MNKRLVIIFSSLVLLVLIIVLSSTVFVVRDISVQSDNGNSWYNSEEIIDTSLITQGKNIFSISESKAITNIEQANSYIKVTSIERIFPNKIIIHITLRVPIVAIPINNSDNHIITDWELNVIDIVSPDDELYINSTEIKGIEVTIDGQAEDIIGTKIEEPTLAPIVSIATAAKNLGISDEGFRIFFEHIDFTRPYYAYIKTNSGVTLALVVGTDTSIEDQFQSVYSIYVGLDINDNKRNSGYYSIQTVNGSQGWIWSSTLP